MSTRVTPSVTRDSRVPSRVTKVNVTRPSRAPAHARPRSPTRARAVHLHLHLHWERDHLPASTSARYRLAKNVLTKKPASQLVNVRARSWLA